MSTTTAFTDAAARYCATAGSCAPDLDLQGPRRSAVDVAAADAGAHRPQIRGAALRRAGGCRPPRPRHIRRALGFRDEGAVVPQHRGQPRVRVYTGSHAPAPATARVLERAEADCLLAAYRSQRPRAWARLRAVLEETLGQPITDTDTPLPMVMLRLDR